MSLGGATTLGQLHGKHDKVDENGKKLCARLRPFKIDLEGKWHQKLLRQSLYVCCRIIIFHQHAIQRQRKCVHIYRVNQHIKQITVECLCAPKRY